MKEDLTEYHGMDLKNKVWKEIKLLGVILILSGMLGINTLILTAIPSDLSLIRVLLGDFRIIVLNTWPIFCVMCLLYFCTNRIWSAFGITAILFFILAEINRFKIFFRDDPFVFGDILLIGEAREMAGRYKLFLDKVSLCALIFIIVTLVLCIYFIKLEKCGWKIRIGGSILIILIFIGSCNSLYFNNKHHGDMWHWQFGNEWKSANQYMSRGIVYSFISSIPSAITTPPEGYDAEVAEEILGNYKTVNLDEGKKVHIISVMLEAYNDFSVFEEVEFSKDPYKNMHAIQKQSYHGELYTNVFAAGTISTERAFLTGYNDVQLGKKDTESYVRYLKSQGYYTEAMHPCYGWFYDRKNMNEFLGFDNFEYFENKFGSIADDTLEMEKYGSFLSDYDFFDYIIEGFETVVEKGDKYFNFSVTYQNHGPYSDEKEYKEEYITKKENYTQEEYNILNNYLCWIEKTDIALEKLYSYISQSDEPIVLVLFGDHNPWLGENNSVYEMLGINLSLDTAEGGENYYQTPYVFYANDVAKKQLNRDFNEEGNTVSPMFLMSELFEYIGIDGSKYLNYLKDVKTEFSVINPVYVKRKDEYVLRENLENNEKLKEVDWVSYYMKNCKINKKE